MIIPNIFEATIQLLTPHIQLCVKKKITYLFKVEPESEIVQTALPSDKESSKLDPQAEAPLSSVQLLLTC